MFVQDGGDVYLFRISTAYLFVVRFRFAGLDFFVGGDSRRRAFAGCDLMAGLSFFHRQRRRFVIVSFVITRSEITSRVITSIELGGFMVGSGGDAVLLRGCMLLLRRSFCYRLSRYRLGRLGLRHVAVFGDAFPRQNNGLITGGRAVWLLILRPRPGSIAGIKFRLWETPPSPSPPAASKVALIGIAIAGTTFVTAMRLAWQSFSG